MKLHLPAWLLSGLALIVLIGGCAAPGERAASDRPAAAPSAPKTITIGMQTQGEPSSPAMFGLGGSGQAGQEHYLMFHGNLTRFDTQGQPVPNIAEKIPSVVDGDWKILPDGSMEVTWKLRPDVRWHDGSPLVADDYAFGFQVISDPDIPVRRGVLDRVTAVRAVDERTLAVQWKSQWAFASSNASDGVPALPRHLLNDLYQAGDRTAFENSSFWNTGWVGLGPYQLSSWTPGSQIEAVAFNEYFLGRPHIDRVIIRYYADLNTMLANVLAGDVDVVPIGALLKVTQMMVVRNAWEPANGGSTLSVPTGVRTVYLQLRDPSAPWARDLRVRQALMQATDRQSMNETLYAGQTEVADFFVGPTDPMYQLAITRGLPRYGFDQQRVARLLADAGWAQGADRVFRNSAGQPISIDVTASNQAGNVEEAEAVASQWSAAGFVSSPTPYPSSAANAAEIRAKNPGALIFPLTFTLQTALGVLTSSEVGTEQNKWAGGNYGGYINPAYDALYSGFLNTLDPAQRTDTIFQMLKVVDEELPILPLNFAPLAVIARHGVEGPGMMSVIQGGSAWNIHTWDITSS